MRAQTALFIEAPEKYQRRDGGAVTAPYSEERRRAGSTVGSAAKGDESGALVAGENQKQQRATAGVAARSSYNASIALSIRKRWRQLLTMRKAASARRLLFSFWQLQRPSVTKAKLNKLLHQYRCGRWARGAAQAPSEPLCRKLLRHAQHQAYMDQRNRRRIADQSHQRRIGAANSTARWRAKTAGAIAGTSR